MENDPSGGVRPAVGKNVDLEPWVGGNPFGELGGEPLRPAHQAVFRNHHRYSSPLFQSYFTWYSLMTSTTFATSSGGSFPL